MWFWKAIFNLALLNGSFRFPYDNIVCRTKWDEDVDFQETINWHIDKAPHPPPHPPPPPPSPPPTPPTPHPHPHPHPPTPTPTPTPPPPLLPPPKPWSEPMLTRFTDAICGTRGRWVFTRTCHNFNAGLTIRSWWRHQMETFSALLAICAGNSLVPVTRNFYVFFDLRLNKGLSKQWWCWWFETPSPHYDVIVMYWK